MENTSRKGCSALDPLQKFYVVCGVVICLAAIAEFIIWIIDTSKVHAGSLLYTGIGFLALSVGALWFLLTRCRSKIVADTGLWIGVIGCIVLLFIAIALA